MFFLKNALFKAREVHLKSPCSNFIRSLIRTQCELSGVDLSLNSNETEKRVNYEMALECSKMRYKNLELPNDHITNPEKWYKAFTQKNKIIHPNLNSYVHLDNGDWNNHVYTIPISFIWPDEEDISGEGASRSEAQRAAYSRLKGLIFSKIHKDLERKRNDIIERRHFNTKKRTTPLNSPSINRIRNFVESRNASLQRFNRIKFT